MDEERPDQPEEVVPTPDASAGDAPTSEFDVEGEARTLDEGATPDVVAPSAETAAAPTPDAPMTIERVLDISIGVVALTGEALDRTAQKLVAVTRESFDQLPAFLAKAEEVGRGIRTSMFDGADESPSDGSTDPFADSFVGQSEGVHQATDSAKPEHETGEGEVAGSNPTSSAMDVPAGQPNGPVDNIAVAPNRPQFGGISGSLRTLGTSLGLLGGAGRSSAEDEIRTLEDRVRQLERTVAAGPRPEDQPTTVAHSVESGATVFADASTETTADGATYVPGERHAEESLADSSYAISETEEEQHIEAGEALQAAADADSPDRADTRAPRRRRSAASDGVRGNDAPPADAV